MHLFRLFFVFPAVLITCVSATGEEWATASAAPNAVAALPRAGKYTFISNTAIPANEQLLEASVAWHGRRAWRKEGSRLQLTLAAVASLLAMMTVAYLVTQCFKNIGKSFRGAHHSRRLSDNQTRQGVEGADSCIGNNQQNNSDQEEDQQRDQGPLGGGPRRVMAVAFGILSLINRTLANQTVPDNNQTTVPDNVNSNETNLILLLPVAVGAGLIAIGAAACLERRRRRQQRREQSQIREIRALRERELLELSEIRELLKQREIREQRLLHDIRVLVQGRENEEPLGNLPE